MNRQGAGPESPAGEAAPSAKAGRPPATRRVRFLGTLLILAVVLLLSAAGGEVILRIFTPPSLARTVQVATAKRVIPPGFMIPDPEIGWVMAPGFEGESRGEERRTTLRTNSLGLRDREFGPNPGLPRVIFIGDSYTFGYLVEAEETFAKQAERWLNDSEAAPAEVVNAGVNGYGPFEEAALLRRIAPLLSPDVVVMAFFEGNDLRNAEAFPVSYRMGEDGYLHSDDGGGTKLPASYLAAYTWIKLTNVREKLATLEALDLALEGIEQARRIAEENGASFLLVIIPTLAQDRAGRSTLLRAYDRLLGVPDDIAAIVEEEARKTGIDVLSLVPLLEGDGGDGSLRFEGDGHFTPRGHALVGEAIARRIEGMLLARRDGAEAPGP